MKSNVLSITEAINLLNEEEVIAYPTESVYGLGCDPDSIKAIEKLLRLKHRPIDKGLILVADSYDQLLPYIDEYRLNQNQKTVILASWPGPVTWIFPKNKFTPDYLTGQFNTIAVRVTDHPTIKSLCSRFGKPIVSTSANLSDKKPCLSITDITHAFGSDFPILAGHLGGRSKPSQIRDSFTGDIIRH